MRILIVSNNLRLGGKERQIVELLNYLSKNSDHVLGLCLREDKIQYNVDFLDNIEIFKPLIRLSFLQQMMFQRKVIKIFKPEIIHTWESGGAFSITLLKLILFLNIPVVDGTLRYSKSFTKDKIYYWIVRFTRRMATVVVANSLAGIQSLDYGNTKKYIVIPNGMNFNRFSSFEKKIFAKENHLIIGMVASFSRPKDYKTLILACCNIMDSGKLIKVAMVGDGPEKSLVENLIPGKYLENFLFTGSIKVPELFIRTFDIGVLLSKKNHSEGLSNSIMEYLAFGLPVVCTKTGGNVELVQNEINGFLVSHESIREVEEKLLVLINDNQLRKTMGERSKKIVIEKFDISVISSKYLDLYYSMLN